MSPEGLVKALQHLPAADPSKLLVGPSTLDDAGVVRLTDELALVQTVDFFPPIVDEPRAYGQIAAANSLSDVYAMGGTPHSCLSVVGWPVTLAPELLGEILLGGQDKIDEAGAVLAGGHTISDTEIKYGLSVTGLIHPDRIMSNAGARPGRRARADQTARHGRDLHSHRQEKGPRRCHPARDAADGHAQQGRVRSGSRAGPTLRN
jgi:selenide,water dikinase